MKQKKSIVSVLALILSALSLILSALSFFRPVAETADMSILQEENTALRKRLDELTLRLDALTMAEDEDAYCHFQLDTWQAAPDALTLDSAFVQVQLSSGSTLTVETARLMLQRNGEEVCERSVSLSPGAGADSFELALTGMVLPLPELEDDDHLELLLEVTLSNGQRLTASAGGWYQVGGELYSVVG